MLHALEQLGQAPILIHAGVNEILIGRRQLIREHAVQGLDNVRAAFRFLNSP